MCSSPGRCCYAAYFATLETGTTATTNTATNNTATTNTAGIVGGTIGGNVLLLITLSIMLWHVMHCHKKRKSSYSTGQVHSMLPVTFHNPNTNNVESSCVFELTDNTKSNIRGLTLGMDSRTCK